MKIPELKDFSLVDGTALSLIYGHRKSIDLDLFSSRKFENTFIIESLNKRFNDQFTKEEKAPRFGVFGYIDKVKVDFVSHPHSLLKPEVNIDGIRMFSTEDIIAMKVQAILGRGRKKDFWDIAELLKHYPVSDFIKFHSEKYSSQNLLITVPQAITFFADAEDDADPVSLKAQNWETVKTFISNKVSDYLK